jgi:hypothetical protein
MQQDSHGNNSDRESDRKGAQSKERQIPKSPKPRVTRVMLYGWTATLLGVLAGFLISYSHRFSFVSIVLLFLCFVAAAFAIRLSLINHHLKHRTSDLVWLLTVAIGLVVAAELFWWEHAQPQAATHPDAFRIVIESSILVLDDADPFFWLVQNVTNKTYASPVHMMYFVRFTNLKPTPFLIDSYAFGVEMGSNIWAVPVIIDLRIGRLFSVPGGTNFTNAREIDIQYNAFNSKIQNKNIAPNETVFGWIATEGFRGYAGKRMRFQALDANDDLVYMQEVLDAGRATLHHEVQNAIFHVLGSEDISTATRCAYSKLPYHPAILNLHKTPN